MSVFIICKRLKYMIGILFILSVSFALICFLKWERKELSDSYISGIVLVPVAPLRMCHKYVHYLSHAEVRMTGIQKNCTS